MLYKLHSAGARAAGGPRHGAARRNTPPRRTDQLVLKFDAHGERLALSDRVVLQRWIGRWLVDRPHGVVVMVHAGSRRAADIHRARLHALRDTMLDLGVARENVKCTDRPTHPAQVNYGPDAVVIKIVNPPEAEQATPSVARGFDATAALT
ncbi:MAG: hypothetical protein M9915_08920 [Rhizobacter sp.]|nr:hypothetical protein [Rhizobacter sp.]